MSLENKNITKPDQTIINNKLTALTITILCTNRMKSGVLCLKYSQLITSYSNIICDCKVRL